MEWSALFATYSIVARDPVSGQFGVAVQTHQMCVGRVVPWLQPGVGAVATQSLANVSFGPMALGMLREGVPASQVIAALVAWDKDSNRRQVAVVDRHGQAAAWTGDGCLAEATHHVGEGYSVQANMMTKATVVPAMAQAFESAEGDLAQRMMAALRAAQREGGDIRGMQSAALKVVSGSIGEPIWRSDYDLRVDEHPDPVSELARLVRLRRAQHIDSAGDQSLGSGRMEHALALWEEARSLAPELEELAFGQARSLADEGADPGTAAEILAPVLAKSDRCDLWIDLIARLDDCGLIQRPGAAQQLVAELRRRLVLQL